MASFSALQQVLLKTNKLAFLQPTTGPAMVASIVRKMLTAQTVCCSCYVKYDGNELTKSGTINQLSHDLHANSVQIYNEVWESQSAPFNTLLSTDEFSPFTYFIWPLPWTSWARACQNFGTSLINGDMSKYAHPVISRSKAVNGTPLWFCRIHFVCICRALSTCHGAKSLAPNKKQWVEVHKWNKPCAPAEAQGLFIHLVCKRERGLVPDVAQGYKKVSNSMRRVYK